MRNIFVTLSDGNNVLVYTPTLSVLSVKLWAQYAFGGRVSDVVAIPDDQLQYYCIDERMWNSEDDDEKVRRLIRDKGLLEAYREPGRA